MAMLSGDTPGAKVPFDLAAVKWAKAEALAYREAKEAGAKAMAADAIEAGAIEAGAIEVSAIEMAGAAD